MHGFVCPNCKSQNIGENIVDWGDDEDEFYCRDCHHVGSADDFTPKKEEVQIASSEAESES